MALRLWSVSALILTAVIGAVLLAQDKPAAHSGSENRLVTLAKGEDWEVRSGSLAKGVTVDTTGYSEVRFVVSIRGPVDTKGVSPSIGKTVKRWFDFYATTSSGVTGQVQRMTETGSPEGKIFEAATLKTYGGKLQLVVRLAELEVPKVEVDIDAYLIK
jgi:hypothetical protein